MAVPVHYVTKQAVLKEAGFWQKATDPASGDVDGTNRVFTVSQAPIVKSSDSDDDVDTFDVHAFVDGQPVELESVDAEFGILTLLEAPQAGSDVRFDYRFSPVSDEDVEAVRDEAEDYIASRMDAIDPLPYTVIPPTVRKIARVYAAGLLLAREYGFQRETDGTSKDGMARIDRAEKWLDAYVMIGGSTGLSDVSAAEMTVTADPNVFDGFDQASNRYISRDDQFMRDYGRDQDGWWR